MISKNIKHISYNYLKQELKIVYSNMEEKKFQINENEYKKRLSKCDFNFNI